MMYFSLTNSVRSRCLLQSHYLWRGLFGFMYSGLTIFGTRYFSLTIFAAFSCQSHYLCP